MLKIMSLNIFQLHHVDQCDDGMLAKKPTFFAGWRMHRFSLYLSLFKAPVDMASLQLLTGRNDDGTFRTAVGKEYPAASCKVIAFTMGDFVRDAESMARPLSQPHLASTINFDSLLKPCIVALDESPS